MEVLDKTVWININYRTWQGKKTLTRAEITRYSDPDKIPPEDLISPGTKAITDPEKLTRIDSLGKRIHRECQKVCIKAFGAYGTSLEASEALLAKLNELKAEHQKLIDDYLDGYDQSNAEWIAEHPEWEDWLRNSMLSRNEIEGRFKFEFQAYKISAGGESALINNGFEQEQSGLLGQLLSEIAKMANEAWDKTYINRDKVSQKALSPIRTMQTKLRTLSYLSSKVGVLIKRVHDVLDAMPKSGPIEGADLSSVCGLLNLLSSTQKMRDFIDHVPQSLLVTEEMYQVEEIVPTSTLEPAISASDTEAVEYQAEDLFELETLISPVNKPVAQPAAFCF